MLVRVVAVRHLPQTDSVAHSLTRAHFGSQLTPSHLRLQSSSQYQGWNRSKADMPPPTGTIPSSITRFLQARQSTPTGRSDQSTSGSNLSGGAIAGIVIGSIVGFLLLWWIIKSLGNLGAPPQEKRDPAWYDDVSAMGRRSRHGRRTSRASYYVQETQPRRSSREVTRVVQPVYVEPRRPSRSYVVDRQGGRGRSRSLRRSYYVS